MGFAITGLAAWEQNAALEPLPDNVFTQNSALSVTCSLAWTSISTVTYAPAAQLQVRAELQKKVGASYVGFKYTASYYDINLVNGGGGYYNDGGQALTFGFSTLGSVDTSDCRVHVSMTLFYRGLTTIDHLPDTTLPIAVYQYSVPTIPAFTANRCLSDGTNNDEGTRIEVTVQYAYTSLGGNNTPVTLKIYRKLTTESTWTYDSTLTMSGTSGTIDYTVTALTYATDTRYDVKAELVDLLTTVTNMRSILPSFVMGEVDNVNHRESFMKRLETDSPAPGNDFGEPVMFRKPFLIADIPGTLAKLGLVAANAIASPRGAMTGGTYYCMKWAQQYNSDADNLVPFTITGDTGLVRGWTVKRAGYYRVSYALRWDSGSTAANSVVSLLTVPTAQAGNITDTKADLAAVEALNANAFYAYLPGTSAAVTQSYGSFQEYLAVDTVVVVYATTSATKTQDTTGRLGRFSIERVS